MGFPNRIYDATATLGLYYAPVFTGSGPQPVWTTLNTGLPATTFSAFSLDRSATPKDSRMYCIVGGTIYMRTSGVWAAVLTSVQARAIAGYVDGQWLAWLTVDPITGYVYSLLGYGNYGSAFGIVRSIDHGANWTYAYINHPSILLYAFGSLDAYNGLVVMGYIGHPLGHRNSFSTNHGVNWTSVAIGGSSAGYWVPVRINPLLANKWYAGRFEYSDYWDLVRVSTASVVEDLNPNQETGFYSPGGIWFDPNDIDHMLSFSSIFDGKVANETFDAFATLPTRNGMSIGYLDEVAEDSQEHYWVHGCQAPSSSFGRSHVYVSTDGFTCSNRSGTNWNTPPYTDAIPVTAGETIMGGLWAEFNPPAHIYVGHVTYARI